MRKRPTPDINRAQVSGRLEKLRKRWTPDGSLSVIAELITDRPQLGPVRAGIQDEQPMPLRAQGKIAEALLANEHRNVVIKGCLRRRYYSREGEPCWGQVEIWVDQCTPVQANKIEE